MIRVSTTQQTRLHALDGVDLNDMLTGLYWDNRKTEKNVFSHMFQRYMVSACILYNKISSNKLLKPRLRFMEDVIDSLAKEQKDAV